MTSVVRCNFLPVSIIPAIQQHQVFSNLCATATNASAQFFFHCSTTTTSIYYTGYRYCYRHASMSNSRLPHTCSSVAVRKFCIILSWWLSSCRRRSWATTTLHREPDNASLPGPIAPLVTELLQLRVPGYGTDYCQISEMLTYHTVSSGSH